MPERFGLFTIIVFGETIVAVALGTADSDRALDAAVAGSFGFVVCALLWWIYFGTGAGMTMLPTVRAILVFTHAHIPVLAALTAVSAGVALAIEQASHEHLDGGARWALAGGAAVYLVCLTVAQRALVRGVTRRKVVARMMTVAALAALAAAGGELGPALFVALTVALLFTLVVFELWAYTSTGPRR